MRGEDDALHHAAAQIAGAPPRAWGGQEDLRGNPIEPRSTPTRVGRTDEVHRPRCRQPEHPHVRGEDPYPKYRHAIAAGAPPRAWGGLEAIQVAGSIQRSTPTCVGRTTGPACTRPCPTEHPHVRGEDRRKGCSCRRNPEHPHVRGEDSLTQRRRCKNSGAPPRAWGGRFRGSRSAPRPRSTPTCVGRTTSTTLRKATEAEHPHVRGEDVVAQGSNPAQHGAPPRAWGGRPSCPWCPPTHRSTPTCVGRTIGVHHYRCAGRSTPTCVGRTVCG